MMRAYYRRGLICVQRLFAINSDPRRDFRGVYSQVRVRDLNSGRTHVETVALPPEAELFANRRAHHRERSGGPGLPEFPQGARYRPSRRGQGCAVSAATKRSARGVPKPVVMS